MGDMATSYCEEDLAGIMPSVLWFIDHHNIQ